MSDRVYGKNIKIEQQKVKSFFNSMSVQGENQLKSVNLQSDSHLSKERDKNERDIIVPLLNLSGEEKVLEIGCGIGRFAEHIKRDIKIYQGIDFSQKFIELAQTKFSEFKNIHFQLMSATKIEQKKLKVKPKFDLIVTMGLMMYLNDEDCEYLVDKILQLASSKSKIYIRESISLSSQRLTLKDFFSDELGVNYSAIYRTKEDYENIFEKYFLKNGYQIYDSALLLKGNLANRKETNQRYWLLKKSG